MDAVKTFGHCSSPSPTLHSADEGRQGREEVDVNLGGKDVSATLLVQQGFSAVHNRRGSEPPLELLGRALVDRALHLLRYVQAPGPQDGQNALFEAVFATLVENVLVGFDGSRHDGVLLAILRRTAAGNGS